MTAPSTDTRPLYQHKGTGPIDGAAWPVADERDADGATLYHYVMDTDGGQPTGASDEWVPYTTDTTTNAPPSNDAAAGTSAPETPDTETAPTDDKPVATVPSQTDKPGEPTEQPATSNDAAVQAIDIPINDGAPAAKADVTAEHIADNPQSDVLAWDPPAVGFGDPTVPRADSHDPRPATY